MEREGGKRIQKAEMEETKKDENMQRKMEKDRRNEKVNIKMKKKRKE